MEREQSVVKVSVIVPVHNAAAYLTRSIGALAEQTLASWEAICVDDGSSDNSLEVLGHLAETDPRIRVLHQANSGAAAARNRGMEHARGEYVFFLDSDDFLEPHALETLTRLADESEAPFTIMGYLTYADGASEREYRPPFFYGFRAAPRVKVTPWMMVNMTPFVWMNLYKRRFLQECGISFRSFRVAEDVVYTMRVWMETEYAAVTSEPLYHYIRHESSVIGQFGRKPYPVSRYLKYYFEVGRLFREYARKKTPGLRGKAAAAYVIMLREKGAAVTYRHYDPVHDYAWICRANRCLRGRLWKRANKGLILLFLVRIAAYKLCCRLFRRA